jgi:hypothetical protein
MAIDLNEAARNLKVVLVYQDGNETGWVTPRVLYDYTVKTPRSLAFPLGEVVAPRKERTIAWFLHGTVGANTLAYWGSGQSATPKGMWTLAKYLVPHDQTQYRDGRVYDTALTVFKMHPDWAASNHTGYCFGPFNNRNSIGVEYESRQNGIHDISAMAYVKGALLYAYQAAYDHLNDAFCVSHGLVASPWGRRTDPWAGKFDFAYHWWLVEEIRRDARIWEFWQLPQP